MNNMYMPIKLKNKEVFETDKSNEGFATSRKYKFIDDRGMYVMNMATTFNPININS